MLFAVYEGSTCHLGLYVQTDGTISLYREGNTNYLIGTSIGGLTEGTWHYLEWKWNIHDTTGTSELRLNGSTILSVSSKDTRNGATGVWTSARILGHSWAPSGSQVIDFDDFYLLDLTDSGITGRPNNDFLGDVSVRYMAPTSDSSVTWDRTGSGLTANCEAVDDATPDGDTTYVSTSTVDEIDYYGFPDVTAGATVYGVQAVISAKKGDTGSAQVAACVKTSGGSDREHPTPLGIASDSSYSFFLFPWDGSPETGSAWTESEVNGAAFGPRKTA